LKWERPELFWVWTVNLIEGLETLWVAGLWVIVNLRRAGLGDLGTQICPDGF
jgi:hypothetical protein